MLHGHGDDLYNYPNVSVNFSSNVYNHFDHSGLFAHLASQLHTVTSYPEPTAATLERRLAALLGLDAQQVMACSGATEAIYLVAQAFSHSRSAIVAPTFAEYADACRLNGHAVCHLSQLADLPSDVQLLWLCNPNNPTGTVIDRDQLLTCIDSHPQVLFVIDASYAPFTCCPTLSAAEAVTHHNIIMLHSMTKRFAVPGLRLGFATAAPALLQQLRSRQMPWSVGSLAQQAALYLLDHVADYVLPIDELLAESRLTAEGLRLTGSIEVCPSDTHILLCRLRHVTAAQLKDYLACRHGLLIRDASNFHGLSPAHFRIAVQQHDENRGLVEAVKGFLAEGGQQEGWSFEVQKFF